MSVRQKRAAPLGAARIGGGGYRGVVLADAPGAFWLLNEPVGSSAFVDSSGNGRNGAISGTPTFGAAALGVGIGADVGTATTFASCQAVTASATWLDAPAAVSVEAWIKTTSSSGWIAVSRDSSSIRQFHFRMTAAGALEWDLWDSAGTTHNLITTGTYRDGLPHHVVMTASGTAQIIYVDGALVATTSGLTMPTTSSVEPVYIGNYSGGGFQYVGTMQAVAIYKSELTAAKVLAHYQAGV